MPSHRPATVLGDIPSPSTLVATVFFSGGFGSERKAALSACADAMGRAPAGERVRVNVRTEDDHALALKSILKVLGSLLPVLPTTLEPVPVFEDADAGVVIFFPNPRDASSARIVVSELGHVIPFVGSTTGLPLLPPSEVEITPEMIEAGMQAYACGDVRYDTLEEIVSQIFKSMYGARPEAKTACLEDRKNHPVGECCD